MVAKFQLFPVHIDHHVYGIQMVIGIVKLLIGFPLDDTRGSQKDDMILKITKQSQTFLYVVIKGAQRDRVITVGKFKCWTKVFVIMYAIWASTELK